MLKSTHYIKYIFTTIIVSMAFFFTTSVSAASCKGMSQSACSKSSSCTYVKSYKTKKGKKVAAYCRNKGKSSSKGKKEAVKKGEKTSKSTKKSTKKSESNKTSSKTTKSKDKKSKDKNKKKSKSSSKSKSKKDAEK